jgi:hypothetical protein
MEDLEIHNCQAATTFNFLTTFNNLTSIILGEATALTLGSLLPVLHENLDVLELRNAFSVVTDALLDVLINRNISLLRLNVPLEPAAANNVGFSSEKLAEYVTRYNDNSMESLNIQGHRSIDRNIWRWPLLKFKAFKYINVRHTAIQDMNDMRILGKRLNPYWRVEFYQTGVDVLTIDLSANEDPIVIQTLRKNQVIVPQCHPEDLVQAN